MLIFRMQYSINNINVALEMQLDRSNSILYYDSFFTCLILFYHALALQLDFFCISAFSKKCVHTIQDSMTSDLKRYLPMS